MGFRRWRVSVNLLLAALSFWMLWFGPLALAAGLGWLYFVLWFGPARGTGATGLMWSGLIGVIGGASLNGIILFVRISMGLRRARRKVPAPRRGPSGLAINEGEAPDLFALLARVRERVGLREPVEIRVDFSAQAGYATYKRRAVVIGLPLFAALSVEELEMAVAFNVALLRLPSAVLRLALWTKSIAIIRYMSPCWNLCGWAFGTANRYAAALASRDGGDAEHALQALEKVTADFDAFWAAHVQMLLKTGHLIPILEGFQEYRKGSATAISLLRSPSAIEGRATNLIAQVEPRLDTISWNQAPTVLLDSWTSEVEQKADQLRNSTVGEICDLFGRDSTVMTGHLLGAAMAVALSRAGWKFLYDGPGSSLAFGRDGKVCEPFTLVDKLAAGGVKGADWRAACADNDIAGLHLA